MLLFLLSACLHHDSTEHPLLAWRVEKDGHVSHLLGTCHVGVDLDYALPKPYDAALTGARVVYTEADVDLADPIRALRLTLTDGAPLSERLAPEDWRAVAVHLRDVLPASMLDRMQPWVVSTLAEHRESVGATDGKAMDQEVQRRAKAAGVPLAYVETLEQQAALLAKWNDAFVEALRPHEASRQGSALADLCYRGEVRDMQALLDPNDPMTEPLIFARNRAWLDTLVPELDQGRVFVAVGAAHMLGDDGLVALLRGRGFTVTQLTSNRSVEVGSLGGDDQGLPAAPPASPQLDSWTQTLPGVISQGACVPGEMLTTCFEPDIERCRARVRADARLCLLQHADEIPANGPAPALQQEIVTCAIAGLSVEALAFDRLGSGPACAAIGAAMRKGG